MCQCVNFVNQLKLQITLPNVCDELMCPDVGQASQSIVLKYFKRFLYNASKALTTCLSFLVRSAFFVRRSTQVVNGSKELWVLCSSALLMRDQFGPLRRNSFTYKRGRNVWDFTFTFRTKSVVKSNVDFIQMNQSGIVVSICFRV